MILRRLGISALIVLVGGALCAQAPTTTQTFPLGDNSVFAPISSVDFEVQFNEPVLLPDTAINFVGEPSGTPFTVRSGFDQALEFSATSHRARSAGTMSMGADITIEFWLRADLGGETCPFSYAATTPGQTNEFTIFMDGTVWVDNTQYENLTTPTLGAWQHWAYVRDSATNELRIYLDGVLTDTVAGVGFPTSAGLLILGDDQDSFGGSFSSAQAFDGAIDELRIWNTVRTPAEIEANRFDQISETSTGLAHYWRFNTTADLGTPSFGGIDVADLTGDADLGLENGLAQAPSKALHDTHWVNLDTSGITSDQISLQIIPGVSGGCRNTAGTFLSPNPFPASEVRIRPTSAPKVLPQLGDPTTAAFAEGRVEFDQFVNGLTETSLVSSMGTISNVKSAFGNALELSSIEGHARTPSPVTMPSNDMTFECWFRTTNPGAGLITFAANSTLTNALLVLANGRVYWNNLTIFPPVDLGQTDGEWHHIMVSRNPVGFMRRFIDGVPAGSVSNTPVLADTSGYLAIGNDYDLFTASPFSFAANNALDGAIDEIRIWSHARLTSVDDPARRGEIDPTHPDLWLYLRCEEVVDLGVGSSLRSEIADLSGNARHLEQGSTSASFFNFNTTVDQSAVWTYDLVTTVSGPTKFVTVDLTLDGSISNDGGLFAAPADSGSPAFEQPFVEDLTLEVSVNGGDAEFGRIALSGGEQVLLTFESPNGSHDWQTIPLLIGQLITTGNRPVANPTFPEIRLDLASPTAPFVVYDGALNSPFGPGLLVPGGVSIGAIAPMGGSGSSLVLQPFTQGGTTANGILAAGNYLILDL
jgi:concanavalin A-like lectin/glucanase superfamily protein